MHYSLLWRLEYKVKVLADLVTGERAGKGGERGEKTHCLLQALKPTLGPKLRPLLFLHGLHPVRLGPTFAGP